MKWKTVKVGFPIRRSPDQRVLAPPRSLSQLATSFFASQRQGIRQKPFSTLDRSQQNPCAGMKSSAGKRSPTIPAPGLYFARRCLLFRSSLKSHLSAGLTLPSQCQSAHPGRSPEANETCFPSDHERLVEPDGIEPTTSCLQSTRSTN